MNIKFRLAGIISLVLLIALAACTKQEPIASFSVDYSIIEQGANVNFTDQSLNNPVSWNWTFTGGTPASSTEQNPSVTYENAGKFPVSLSVTNEDGSDAAQRNNYITVNLPAPEANFSSDKTTIEAGGTINFADMSENEPSSWSWDFPGGTPSTSTLQNPSIQYQIGGTYGVGLTVMNESGSDYYQQDNYITVTQTGTSITFNNTTYTDVDISINGIQKVIPSGGSVIYAGLTGSSVNFIASTSGETTTGTQVGYLMYWDNTITLDQPNITRNLIIANTYYFLYIKNQGTESINKLEIGIQDVLNGFTIGRTENLSIPNDNVQYRLGYYESYTATIYNWIQIYAYTPSWLGWWSQGTHFTLPGTENQSILLTSTLKKSSAESSSNEAGDPATYLYPDYAINPKDK